MVQPLLRKEEHRQSRDGHTATGLHTKSIESSLTEINCVAGTQELRSAPEMLKSENSFEKVQYSLKMQK